MSCVRMTLGEDYELDTGLFELRRAGERVNLEPQAFDVLVYLVFHRDRVVPKEELMDAVWGGQFVTESAVTSRIKQVRRAIGDDGQAQRSIRTIHGRGYRFVGDVTSPADNDLPSDAKAPVRYTTSDGLHIAYQVTGSGDLDIVLIPGFVSHLELDWTDPRHAHFLDRLGSMGRLIRFDKRGTGMSDRPSGVPNLETRMHDVLAVMDAVDCQRAVVCGYSEGGPMAILLAAMHPERLSSLILYGSYAKRTWAPDYPWAERQEDRMAYTENLVTAWDWEADMRWRCPSADEAMQKWWGQRMRAAATPSTVRALMDMNSLVDVREVLAAVRVPTLVLNRTGDALIVPEEARYLAERIPGATLTLLDGDDHFVSGNPDQILDPIESFITRQPRPATHPLALAAVVAPLGEGSEELVQVLEQYGGRRRHTVRGATVVLFDGPATAVRYGLDALTETTKLGLSIAEVPRDNVHLEGRGVEQSIVLAQEAPDGGMYASAMASLLLAGSGVILRPLSSTSDRAELQDAVAVLAP
jgi:DNA-binding winged helix-turn-helix (wHTH) protein/dienelactone hydrolase